jgi:hypothetical protein
MSVRARFVTPAMIIPRHELIRAQDNAATKKRKKKRETSQN